MRKETEEVRDKVIKMGAVSNKIIRHEKAYNVIAKRLNRLGKRLDRINEHIANCITNDKEFNKWLKKFQVTGVEYNKYLDRLNKHKQVLELLNKDRKKEMMIDEIKF